MPAKRQFAADRVIEIRNAYRGGMSVADLACTHSVSATSMHGLLTGKTYAEIPGVITTEMRGKGVSGSFSSRSLIDEIDAANIKKLLIRGMTAKCIGEVLNIQQPIIWAIAQGITWKSVGPNISGRLKRNRNTNTVNRPRGSKHAMAKLDELTVSYIKWHLNVGVANILLAKYFKVSQCTIGSIARERTWKHVKPKESPFRILAPERKLPIRLRGDRLKLKFKDLHNSSAAHNKASTNP